jgi:SMC interacting uncharacterized protein involved in chromosome segregation
MINVEIGVLRKEINESNSKLSAVSSKVDKDVQQLSVGVDRVKADLNSVRTQLYSKI